MFKYSENRKNLIKNKIISEIIKKKYIEIKKNNDKLYINEIERIDTPVIPLKLFMYWHSKDLPERIRQNVEFIKKVNPEFEVIVYDDEMTKEFLKYNFHNEVLNAYNKLIPISFKSDLFRFCILYIYGGIYLDIKFQPINNFKLISLAKYNEVWSHEGRVPGQFDNKCIANTGFILTQPKNEHLKIAIDNILYNVKNKISTRYSTGVSGPVLLTKSFNFDVMSNDTFKVRYVCDFGEGKDSGNILFITWNNDELLKPIFKFYDGYRADFNKKSPQLHWSKMWKNNQVYKI